MTTTFTGIEESLDRLARVSSQAAPVVSVYLDLRPDQRGRKHHLEFFDRAMDEQIATFNSSSPAHRQLQRSAQRIRKFIQTETRVSAAAAAIFSCAGDPDVFEALQLDVPIDGHRLYIDRQPHLFPLARLTDEYAKYATLVVDTNAARLFVFAIGALQRKLTIANEKPTRTPGVDVFSEGEYQRNSENLHKRHMKEVARAVERVVREEHVRQIFVAGGDVALPLLRNELPNELRTKVLEIANIDMNASDAGVLERTLEAFKQTDAVRDRDDVTLVLDAFRARGLGTIGLERVRAALTLGQVDRLLLPAVAKVRPPHLSEAVIEDLLITARRTDAAVTFIEESGVLDPAGGVAAFLRFRLAEPEARRD